MNSSLEDTIFDINDLIAFIASLTANIAVMLIVFKVPNKDIRTHRWLLNIQSSFELLNALLIYALKLVSYDPDIGIILGW